MQPAILATKLYVPTRRANWVMRPRLLQKLNDGRSMACKLTLISAPAGFGKTTLATEWINTLQASHAAPAKIAWFSLDPSDNDLRIFLSYVLSALQVCLPEIGQTTRELLDHNPLPPIENLLLPLVNDLASLTTPIILVLDDYHTVQQPIIHQATTFLIERQPPHMQVVITTRQDPLLPLSRWRARGWLTDIRLKDLRFTEDEAAEFLNQAMGFQLQPADIAALETRTEGWIAGLQLAAVSLLQSNQGCAEDGSITSFVQSFTGNDRYVMDYLIDEVLCRQPEPIQRFLLYTSILERFNASLCAAILADDDQEDADDGPEEILDYLDRANLFLIALDNRREWYRYHHLFADLLQHRLKSTEGRKRFAALKRRAGQWFDEHNAPEEAIRCAQSAGDWEFSTQLIEKHAPTFMQRGELSIVLRWLSAMPDKAIRANAAMCRYYGYLLGMNGKLETGHTYLQIAEQDFPGDLYHLGTTLAFASYHACFAGDFVGEINLAQRALGLLAYDKYWERGIAATSLGLGLCHIGDPQGCEAAMHEALEAGRQSNTVRTCVHALSYLGRMAVLRLDFQQADIYYRQAMQFYINGRIYPGCDIAIFDLAQMKYEQNDLQQAMQLLEQGIEANQRSGGIEMRSYGYRQFARLYQLRGEQEKAQEFLQKGLRLAQENNLSPLSLSLDAACRVEMALSDGNLPAAEQAAPYIVNALGLFTFNFFPEMARAHLLVCQGRKAEALALLQPAIQRAEQPGWEYPRLQMRVLQALIEADAAQAKQRLREALALAEKGGAVRCFVDLGAPMLSLLKELRPQLKPSESAYADRVINAFHAVAETQTAQPHFTAGQASSAKPKLIEALSERELEVLRLLADGLSNAEIAERLYLSPNTLKAHTQNIYSKLDVHSRVQVINKARELGLLS